MVVHELQVAAQVRIDVSLCSCGYVPPPQETAYLQKIEHVCFPLRRSSHEAVCRGCGKTNMLKMTWLLSVDLSEGWFPVDALELDEAPMGFHPPETTIPQAKVTHG